MMKRKVSTNLVKEKEFINLIKKHFDFLMEKYGFSIIYSDYSFETFGNCMVVLESKDCRIRIEKERGQVFLSIALRCIPYICSKDVSLESFRQWQKQWYDLSHVTSFLTQGPNQVNWKYKLPEPGFDEKTCIERQMVRLTRILEPYWNRIIELFQEESFKKKQKELDEFIRKLAEEKWGTPRKK